MRKSKPDKPAEPDWNQVIEALEEADGWLMNQDKLRPLYDPPITVGTPEHAFELVLLELSVRRMRSIPKMHQTTSMAGE
jgi:hypothetical protein